MSEDNHIKIGNSHVVFNGGNTLPGAPINWESAHEWQAKANEGKEDDAILWSFDCGFKLDYDGAIVSVSSRFYPPAEHYGPTWDGTVSIYVMQSMVAEQKFDCKTLDELKTEVELFVYSTTAKIYEAIKTIFP